MPQIARGFVLGTVDLVPGVSGGTAALALGIYRHLIASLHHCAKTLTRALRGDMSSAKQGIRRVPALWLGGLGLGILTIVFVLAGPLEHALTNHPLPLAGLFLGLIVAAVVLCWRQLHSTVPMTYLLVGVAAVATFLLLGLAPTSSGTATEAPSLWVFFGAGAIAICAMILPGISGSFLLVLMGMYAHVLAAVSTRDFLVLGVFLLGCVTGLALAASGLNWLLHRYHDLVLAAMIGLMIGSVRLLWPWPAVSTGPSLHCRFHRRWLCRCCSASSGSRSCSWLICWPVAYAETPKAECRHPGDRLRRYCADRALGFIKDRTGQPLGAD